MPTIKVSESTLKKVKKLGKKQQINNGEFVDLAADFFIKTDLDLDADYSIKSEMVKMTKRLNDIIGFIRTNEKEHLIPIVAAVKQASKFVDDSSKELNSYIQSYKPNRIQEAYTDVQELLNEVVSSTKSVIDHSVRKEEASQRRILELEKINKELHRKNAIVCRLMTIDRSVLARNGKEIEALDMELKEYYVR